MSNPRSDLPTIVLHWGLFLSLIASFVTGMQVAADTPTATWALAIRGILPQGNVIVWHLISALFFVGLVVAYIVFLWRAGVLSRIKLDARWRMMMQKPTTRMRAINTLIYWVGFAALAVALVTGLLMDLFPGLFSVALVGLIHQYAAWVLPAYVVLHIVALVVLGGFNHLLKLFRPRLAYGSAALVALAAGAAGAGLLFGLETMATGYNLSVAKTDAAPKLDGRADSAEWGAAQRVTVPTNRGSNHTAGEVDITVSAMHDGEYIYTLIQWPDSTRSQKHLPLVKTETGWKVQQTEYGIQDEDSYYEDKFGVMLSDRGRIAGNHSIHMGDHPLANKPGPSGGRGLHYTTDGSIVDVWHWKSVRTGNSVMNQIDDNYFGAPMKPKEGKRYTGGYTKDPKAGGGYSMNWEKYADAGITPKFLPKDPALLEPFQAVDLTPTVGDTVALFMNKEDVVPYDPALDSFPVGTIMPAVVVTSPMEGDRGDVTSVSHWEDGVWTMEIKRKLDTGSEFDIAFTTERPTYLWVSAFDHAQTRHTRHLYPVEVTLQ